MIIQHHKTSLLLFVLLFFNIEIVFAKDCLETNAAFDIGSGTTKVKVAMVDSCQRKIVKILLDESRPVPYKDSMKDSSIFSHQIRKKGIEVIKGLQEKIKQFRPQTLFAVATSAFRSADNAASFVQEIKNQTNLDVKIISQKDEGKLAFIAASSITYLKADSGDAWNMVGGCMHVTTIDVNCNFTLSKEI